VTLEERARKRDERGGYPGINRSVAEWVHPQLQVAWDRGELQRKGWPRVPSVATLENLLKPRGRKKRTK
jgi:hypothetical protein